MKTIYPEKLKSGDKVGVVVFSGAAMEGDEKKIDLAKKYLESRGLEVVLPENLTSTLQPLEGVSVQERVSTLDVFLSDPDVRAIWSYGGGDIANQVLPELDYKKIKKTKKLFLGMSDNTSILNAIHSKTSLVTYYAPNFGGLAKAKGSTFTRRHLESAVFGDTDYNLGSSSQWHEKDYSKKATTYHSHKNSGWWLIQEAIGEGKMVGGEISTMLLLHGTSFAPDYKNTVVCLEQYRGDLAGFDRMLEAILQQKNADKLQALVIGRFQSEADINKKDLSTIISRKPQLKGVPVIANVDFGHTEPFITLPIGGNCLVRAMKSDMLIRIEEH